ncbi:MAG TPA: tRNA lysidine(34) synthetase TilS [Bryobacteraceae bacterium]|nr:tRNA lysidine(34) synthetase TilS [Bryobacteraceae bacterium]
MLERVAEFITRHRMFGNGQRVGVAVSGGADSVFLLHVLRELAPRWNLKLSVIHIEHGIRGADSVADAEFVRALAAGFGLPFHFREANIPAIDDNLEQAAREVRQNFYIELIRSGTLDCVATGHTRSDQAETVLYRLLRGSGLAGLSGILPVASEGIVRPLLEVRRGDIEAWLRGHEIEWREDATNQDRAYARNRLRHEILPLLRDSFNPQLDEALANLATLAQDEESYWQSEVARHLPPTTNQQPLVLPVSQFASTPPALARRLIRRIFKQVKGDLRQIDFAHVERVLAMVRSAEGSDRVILPGLDVYRSFDWIRVARPGLDSGRERDFSFPLAAPGTVELPRSNSRISLQIQEKTAAGAACVTVVDELDWLRFSSSDGQPSLELRNWRPGDQYQPAGQSKREKIKFLFQEARIPLWERRNWPIITYNGTIVWVRRFGAAAEFAAGPATRVVLRVGESALDLSRNQI